MATPTKQSVAISPLGSWDAENIRSYGSIKAFIAANESHPDFAYYNEGEAREEAMARIYKEAEALKLAPAKEEGEKAANAKK